LLLCVFLYYIIPLETIIVRSPAIGKFDAPHDRLSTKIIFSENIFFFVSVNVPLPIIILPSLLPSILTEYKKIPPLYTTLSEVRLDISKSYLEVYGSYSSDAIVRAWRPFFE